MNISAKHHYLPEFYLKGFTNIKNVFAIYDYNKNNIKKGMHSPSTHFFEKNRNLIEFEGRKSDLPEQHYNFSENQQSKLLQKIQTSELVSLNHEEMIILQEFVSGIFWRIPANDNLYLEQLNNDPILTNSYKIIKTATKEILDNKTIENLRTSEVFIKGLRPAAAGASLLANANNDFSEWGITFTKSDNQVCSDNPLVFINQKATNIFESDFIFPVTKHHLLIKSSKKLITDKYLLDIKFLSDILIFKQGKFYCCCANPEYLRQISEMSEKFNIDQLRTLLLDFLEKTTNG